ncbi:hypothetical protein I4F81_003050 [Pyropia yezoensis]|uniref:Uncharacterized protein n=1 Tax=Pyropia yezoensis TaxID=2788 RepID=A0ACC3BR46_PYRYE|nr:hypothetical protein I4F81_003050 [Neopyropia yezoensis]
MGLVQEGETVDEEDIMPASAMAVGSGNGGSAADARGAADADAAGNAAMQQTATDGKTAAEWAAHGDAARGLAGADAERCVLCEAYKCIAQDQILTGNITLAQRELATVAHFERRNMDKAVWGDDQEMEEAAFLHADKRASTWMSSWRTLKDMDKFSGAGEGEPSGDCVLGLARRAAD